MLFPELFDRIPFNVWDDFYDDGYIPEGEKQDTYGYVENDMPDEEKAQVSKIVYDFIMTLDMTGVTLKLGVDIDFDNLTHARLDKLMGELKNSNLKWNGKEIYFYSES
jgi:hypothetical protein